MERLKGRSFFGDGSIICDGIQRAITDRPYKYYMHES